MALVLFFQSSLRSSFKSEMAPEPCLCRISRADRVAKSTTYSLKTCERFPGVCGGLSPAAPGSFVHPGIVSSVGLPTRSNMILS